MKRTSTWVKICGTTNLRDAQLSIEAGANALGFIFAPSPRRIDVIAAAQIISALSGEVEAIGVFVNGSPARVTEIAEQAGLSGVQLHGDERPEEMDEFRQLLGQRKIIKSLRASQLTGDALAGYLQRKESFDAILLDSGSAQQRGGTGIPFDWESSASTATAIRESVPLIIAGGLNSANVAGAIELFQPWGVDVVSGVESAPGIKDENKLRAFVSAVRQHS